MDDLISRQAAIDAAIEELDSGTFFDIPSKLESLPSAQPELSTEIQEILTYLDTTLHPIVSPDNWNVYAELHDMVSMLPSAQPESCGDVISREYLKEHIEACWINGRPRYAPELYEVLSWIDAVPSAQPETCEGCKHLGKKDDLISRQDAIDAIKELCKYYTPTKSVNHPHVDFVIEELEKLPSAQPDIKQAAKLLSDFIESCPGGDSYLITPDGKKLRTDWGYALNGVQLIYEWAERRTDG